MSLKQVALFVLAMAVLASGTIVLLHPDGVDGLLSIVGVSGAPDDETGTASATGEARTPASRAEATRRELAKGERDLEAGKFDASITSLMVARNAAPDDALRDRAGRGLQRAVIGWALVKGALDPQATDAGAELDALRSRASGTRTEEDWFAALRFAAGAGLESELPQLLGATLDVCTVGGPVEAQIVRVYQLAGPRRNDLRDAALVLGLGDRLVGSGGPTALRHTNGDGGTASGIGGTSRNSTGPREGGHFVSDGIPVGDFSTSMKRKLERGIQLEADGLREFELAGPDGTDRRKHLEAAATYLKEAREIYDEALEMDPECGSLERRYQRVIAALGAVNKDRILQRD